MPAATMRILSRSAFAEVLSEAMARTRALAISRLPTVQEVERQLELMVEATADDRVPSEEERRQTTLGVIAMREFEDVDPEYADALEELDYTFHRYPLLPKGPPIARRGILQVWTGRQSFRKLVLELGVPRTVGGEGKSEHEVEAEDQENRERETATDGESSDFTVHGDPALGSPHFQIVWDGVSAHVNAVEPHAITIDGEPSWYGEVANRGWIGAGVTIFRFLVEDRTPPPEPVEWTDASKVAFAVLDKVRQAGTLYAVIDAARSERALQLIEESVDRYASLYDGEQGRAFDDVAPYLVKLERDSGLLERLVREGWGDAWGIYVESEAEFERVRRHFRQFLKVEIEGEKKPVFFRFYDPRVLRTFAEAITKEQRLEFMNVLERIGIENHRGSMWFFSTSQRR